MSGLMSTVIGSMAVVAGVYIALHYSKNLSSEGPYLMTQLTNVSKTFQGD